MIADKDKIVWKDRKRIFGLPITMTRYFVDDDRLYIKTDSLKQKLMNFCFIEFSTSNHQELSVKNFSEWEQLFFIVLTRVIEH